MIQYTIYRYLYNLYIVPGSLSSYRNFGYPKKYNSCYFANVSRLRTRVVDNSKLCLRSGFNQMIISPDNNPDNVTSTI